jgi:hypothetical protein
MKSILFIIFFVTPPAEKGKEIWSLQSTNTIEFDSSEACVKAGSEIQDTMATVDTVRVRAWCFSERITNQSIQKQGLLPEQYHLDIQKLIPKK